jgi:hypothetical protein
MPRGGGFAQAKPLADMAPPSMQGKLFDPSVHTTQGGLFS